MKKLIQITIIVLLFVSCKKTQEPVDCRNTAITFSAVVTASDVCVAEGSISISANGNYLYRINNAAFLSTNTFNNLLPGKYEITAKNSNNCTKTDSVVIAAKNAGTLFIQTKAVLATYCIRCHSGINPQAGLDWTDNCTIVNTRIRIKARAIDAIPTSMPPAALIPMAERNKILDWINAGGKFTD